MKFTSEDLLKAMGLKENDVIQLETGDIFKVVLNPMHINHDGETYTQDIYKLEFKDSTVRMPIIILLNNSYTIIQPKPTLTEDEKVILRNLNKRYKYINREEYGGLRVSETKPIYSKSMKEYYYSGFDTFIYDNLIHSFKFVICSLCI